MIVMQRVAARGGFFVEQAHAGDGVSETVHGTPRKTLADHVRAYRGYRPVHGESTRLRLVPSTRVYLDISFGTPPRLGNANTAPARAVYGMRTIPTTLVRSDGHGILAELSPLGAYRLLGTPLWTLTDTVTDVVDMVGHQAEQVVDRLAETPGWKARWALLDDALAVRAAAGPRPAPQVAWAWQRLCRSTGGVPITRLAVEAGWTRRHLSTRFREQIGLTPKMAARVIRFQHALRLLRRSGHRAPLVSVAQAAGYSDQAHFSREFRSLAGTTPVELGAAWP